MGYIGYIGYIEYMGYIGYIGYIEYMGYIGYTIHRIYGLHRIYRIHTVKPLITNTSEEFIKCRLNKFSMSFILYNVNFSICENKQMREQF